VGWTSKESWFNSWQGQEIFYSLNIQSDSSPPSLLVNVYQGVFPGEGLMQVGYEADSPPSGAEFKNKWSHNSTPHMFLWHVYKLLYLYFIQML
jgi:hypothetical protein